MEMEEERAGEKATYLVALLGPQPRAAADDVGGRGSDGRPALLDPVVVGEQRKQQRPPAAAFSVAASRELLDEDAEAGCIVAPPCGLLGRAPRIDLVGPQEIAQREGRAAVVVLQVVQEAVQEVVPDGVRKRLNFARIE